MYHVPSRKTPISSMPSPLKSPDHRHVAVLAEVDRTVAVAALAVAVDVEIPAAVAEHADRVDAVAVPVAHQRMSPGVP